MGTSPIVTLEERLVKAKSSRLLQPSPKAQFITEIEMLPLSFRQRLGVIQRAGEAEGSLSEKRWLRTQKDPPQSARRFSASRL
jgi:hypothetical protein